MIRDDLILEDTTLRDGEQTPGVALSKQTKTKILDRLLAIGVTSVEIGIPAMGGEELEFITSVVDRQDEARLVTWHRGVREDIEASLDLGYRAVHMGLPASDLHLSSSVRKDRNWLLRTARDLVGMCKDRGAFVSISAEDLARTDPAFLVDYAHTVREAGADRLRLSDTVGMLTPEEYGGRVAAIARECDIDLQCHAHNDFGLAVANTIAGLQAGARYFHVTINGIGERAGMADIAHVVVALNRLYGVDLGVDLTGLTSLARDFADIVGHPLPPWHPITGENVFAHESGIHVNAMLRDTSSFEPFPPEDVGGQRRYVLGKHSGRALVEWMLAEQGLSVDQRVAADCLARVRQVAIDQGGPLSVEQLTQLHREVTESTTSYTSSSS